MEILYIAAFLLPFFIFYWIWPAKKSQPSALSWGRKVTALMLFAPSIAYFPRYFEKQGSAATDAFVTWAGTSLVLGLFGLAAGALAFWLISAVRRVRSELPSVVESAKHYVPAASTNIRKSAETMADSVIAATQRFGDRASINPPKKSFGADLSDVSIFRSVARELENGFRDAGLWAMAISSADGDETVAQARYIRLRVEEIKKQRSTIDKPK